MYNVLLYYKYVAVPDPEAERDNQRQLCERLGLKGRILIGAEGINGTVSGTVDACQKYVEYMDEHTLFADIEYKIDSTKTVPFPKLKVKVRSEVVTLGADVDLSETAPRIAPDQFDQFMAEHPDAVFLDARNNYESAIGRFRGAITPDIKLFKDFPAALDGLEDLKDKTIVTYCTGGIRCEKASALMKQRGFGDVYQLDGGIIQYAKANPNGAWEGECFVFDERMSVGFKDQPELMGSCHFCESATNTYFNCANAECNDLILVCADCSSSTLCLSCQSQPTKVG